MTFSIAFIILFWKRQHLPNTCNNQKAETCTAQHQMQLASKHSSFACTFLLKGKGNKIRIPECLTKRRRNKKDVKMYSYPYTSLERFSGYVI